MSKESSRVIGSSGRRSIRRQQLCTPYRLSDVRRVWRDGRGLESASRTIYEHWLQRFARYCQTHSLDQRTELTERGADRFAHWWRSQGSPRRGHLRNAIRGSRSALRAWALALSMLGESMPPWHLPSAAAPHDIRFKSFVDYLRSVRGNPSNTITKKLKELTAFDRFRRSRGSARSQISLQDVDAYILVCRRRMARRTVASICSTIRGYLRFLHATGAMKTDIGASVMAPIIRADERPHRTIPWTDVQRILRAIDRKTAIGRRDYAILLMMSVYGLGSGEVIGISLDDINWQAPKIRITRPKTRSAFFLPLLPDVSRAIVDYLKLGRPIHTSERRLFLTKCLPFRPLASSSSVRYILHSAARRAGVTATFLGTHVLRHTHASRQLDLGVAPKIIGDILGHRAPHSTSAYLRVTSDRLRKLSLPVPV